MKDEHISKPIREHETDGTASAEALLIAQLLQTAKEIIAGFEQAVGMSQARLRLLAQFQQTTELSQADLEHRLAVDGAAITRMVKALEGQGLLICRAAPTDNRFTLVSLTDQGDQVLKDLLAKGMLFERMLMARMKPEEIELATSFLQHIRNNIHTVDLTIADPSASCKREE